jgi:AcrR family transcriptional regulator
VREDRRSLRTKRSLDEALLELLRERPFETISVADIAEKANVGRSTFYSHYQDKEDLFTANFARLFKSLGSQLRIDVGADEEMLPLHGFCTHITESAPLVKALHRSRRIGGLYRRWSAMLAESLQGELERQLSPGALMETSAEALSYLLAHQVLGLVRWWVERGMEESPETISRTFHLVVRRGLEQLRA